MRRVARIDRNQSEIVRGLREVGASVADTHRLGGGFPDLVVAWGGKHFLLEIKALGEDLNPLERDWHLKWKGPVHIVRSLDEALRVIGAA